MLLKVLRKLNKVIEQAIFNRLQTIEKNKASLDKSLENIQEIIRHAEAKHQKLTAHLKEENNEIKREIEELESYLKVI